MLILIILHKMDTVELTAIMEKDRYAKEKFIGVYAADFLRKLKITQLPVCFIGNTDPSWKPGTHWLAFYIDHGNNLEFFDSYGQHPSRYPIVSEFISSYAGKIKMNNFQVQSYSSSTCGQFCLYFLLWRCRDISFSRIVNSFDRCTHANDILVTTFINGLFDKNTAIYDVDYVVSQCCRAGLCLT